MKLKYCQNQGDINLVFGNNLCLNLETLSARYSMTHTPNLSSAPQSNCLKENDTTTHPLSCYSLVILATLLIIALVCHVNTAWHGSSYSFVSCTGLDEQE